MNHFAMMPMNMACRTDPASVGWLLRAGSYELAPVGWLLADGTSGRELPAGQALVEAVAVRPLQQGVE
jgi:hypothetical protein